MSDANPAELQAQSTTDDDQAVQTRARAVKPGHLEVGEFTSGHIGASSPFGSATFPLPVHKIYYESSKAVATRILEDERH